VQHNEVRILYFKMAVVESQGSLWRRWPVTATAMILLSDLHTSAAFTVMGTVRHAPGQSHGSQCRPLRQLKSPQSSLVSLWSSNISDEMSTDSFVTMPNGEHEMAAVPSGVDADSPPPLSKTEPELADIPKAEPELAETPIDSSLDAIQTTPLTENVETLFHENSDFGSSFPDPDEQYMRMAIELAKLEYVHTRKVWISCL
jgi:hypothetical protein